MKTNFVEEFQKAVEDAELEVHIEETKQPVLIHAIKSFARYSEVLDSINDNSTLDELHVAIADFVVETQNQTRSQQADVYRILNVFISQFNG